MHSRALRPLFFASVVAIAAAAPSNAAAQSVDPGDLPGLSYRFIGPDGNRVISVMGEPGNPLVMYAGAASGGLFKTELRKRCSSIGEEV